jgi:Cft2 family RNA processing exonuclease
MGGKKKDEKIIVTTCGGQSEGVTGSSTLISFLKNDGNRGLILIELGGIQGNSTILGEYQDNKKLLDNIPVEDIEYVFVAHSHQDHEMHLPYLSANNYNGRIIMTKENLEISKKLLLDSTYIHGKNIEYLKSKGKKVKPFYSEQNCYEVFDRIDTYNVNEIYKQFNLSSSNHM